MPFPYTLPATMGAAGPLLRPTSATAALTPGTPTVTVSSGPVTVRPATATVAVTGGVPVVVSSSGPVTVRPATATVAVTGGAPIVTAAAALHPTTATLTATGGTPILVPPAGPTLRPGTAALTLIGGSGFTKPPAPQPPSWVTAIPPNPAIHQVPVSMARQFTGPDLAMLARMCQAALTGQPFTGGLAAMGTTTSGATSGAATATQLLSGLQQILDFFCQLLTGISTITGTTPSSLMSGATNANNALMGNTIASGILATGQTGGSSGNLAVDFLNGAQSVGTSFYQQASGTSGALPAINPLITFISDVFTVLNQVLSIFGFGNIGGGTTGASLGSSLGTVLNGTTTGLQTVIDGIFQAVNGGATTGNAASTVKPALQTIPNTNVLGLLGPSNVGAAVQSVVDSLWQGLTGASGSGLSLGLLSNAAAQTANNATNAATVGQTTAALLANRAIYKPSFASIDPTADGVFHLTALTGTSGSFVNVAAANSVMGMIGTPDAGVKQSVIWLGQNTTGISTLKINVYSLNTSTGVLTRVHQSADLSGSVSNSLSWNYYNLPTSITATQGNWYAVEMQTTGTGTYQVAGLPNHWLPGNTNVHPQALAATRTAGAVSFDASGAGQSGTTATSGSFTHTGAAGASCVVAFCNQLSGGAAHGSFTRGCTYNGTAMTSLGVIDANNTTDGWVELFGLPGCCTGGADTVAWSLSGGSGTKTNFTVQSSSFLNVGSFGAAVTNAGSSTSLTSTAVTDPGGGMVAQCFAQQNSIGSVTLSAYNQTSRKNVTATNGAANLTAILGDSAAAGSLTFTATGNGTNFYASVAVALNPVALAGPPATIASPTYSPNVPWFGLSGQAGTPGHAPVTTEYSVAGPYTYTPPSWAGHIDVIALGAGAGGQGGFFGSGLGGGAGTWTTVTLTVGSTINTGVNITGGVGAGGTAGPPSGSGNAGNGTATTAAAAGMTSLSAPGGTNPNPGAGGSPPGLSPGNQVLGDTYYGGATQNLAGQNGNAPGGGGAGGQAAAYFTSGGAGAPGAIWFRAYQ